MLEGKLALSKPLRIAVLAAVLGACGLAGLVVAGVFSSNSNKQGNASSHPKTGRNKNANSDTQPDTPYGTISTVAGTGQKWNEHGPGDGGLATHARFNEVTSVAALSDGGFLVVDADNERVRRVFPDGKIQTVAGCSASSNNSSHKFNKCAQKQERDLNRDGTSDMGDGGSAVKAELGQYVLGVRALAGGGFLIADGSEGFYGAIRHVNLAGTISRIAGHGKFSFEANDCSGGCGDGGLATKAGVYAWGVAPTSDGGFLIADTLNDRIRRVSPPNAKGVRTIKTVAGIGSFTKRGVGDLSPSFSGDGGLAIYARLDHPKGVAETPDGGFLIADSMNNRIRKVDRNGIITTVAGSGPVRLGERESKDDHRSDIWDKSGAFSGDGGPATKARLDQPRNIAVAKDGTFYIADTNNNRIRKVDPNGIITTVAGSSRQSGPIGDGGPATKARLREPWDVSLTPNGDLLIADTDHNRVRLVNLHSPRRAR